MASSAILRSLVVFTLTMSLSTSAQCNQDRNASQPVGKIPTPKYVAWLTQDVRWIITDEERAAFKRLRSDTERDQFIEQFWIRRDPTPETMLNEFKQEHYRRLGYVNEHFQARNIPAWSTDQGRIYIMFGPPDQLIPIIRDGPRMETWRYQQIKDIGQNVTIDFVDRCQCGELVIQDWKAESGGPNPKVTNDSGGKLVIMNILQRAPVIHFKDLDEIVTHKICINLVPVSVSTSQAKVTDYTTLIPIKVSVKDQEVTWKEENGERWRELEVYGRISTQGGLVEDIFEETVRQNSDQPSRSFSYEYPAPLRSGNYRINVVVKDVAEDRKGTWSGTILVP